MIGTLIIGLTVGAVYGLVALGFSLIYRSTGLLSFAQGSFVMLGAIIAAELHDDHGWPVAAAVCVAVIVAGAAGVLLAGVVLVPIWKRGRGRLGVDSILATVLFLVIVQNLTLYWFGPNPRTLPPAIDGGTRWFGTFVSYQSLLVLCVTLVLAVAFDRFLSKSRVGRALRACAEDRNVSELLGIRITAMALLVVTVGAVLAAVGGVLLVPLQFVSYSSGAAFNLRGFVAAMLGGLSNTRAAMLGGLVLGVAEAFIARYVSSTYLDVLVLLLLIVVVLVRPGGLFAAAVQARPAR